MPVKILEELLDRKRFNEMANHPLQSWEWGEARKKMGIEVLRIEARKNIFQLTFHKLPFLGYKIGYLPRSAFPTKEVLNFLYEYGKKNRVIFIKIEPYLQGSKPPIENSKFQKSAHPLFPRWTQILKLAKTEEELLRNMKSKTRYNIKLAQKKGVTVKEMSNEKGFEIFSKLYFDTCKRQHYFGHTLKYHKIVWDSLKQNIAHILIAFYKDKPLAAYELFYFKNIMYYPYGGTTLEYRNLMGANLLMWEAVRLAKKLGAEKFDMWGSLPPGYNDNHPWSGFTRFKEGYGGEFVEMVGSYDLSINPTIYKLYNLIYSLRQMYLGLKKIIY